MLVLMEIPDAGVQWGLQVKNSGTLSAAYSVRLTKNCKCVTNRLDNDKLQKTAAETILYLSIYQFIDQFAFLYFRVVALDMRGYGESDKPSGVENYVIEKLDNDLKVRHLHDL